MRKLFTIFFSFIILSSFALMLIPNEVKAIESEYAHIDFEDGTNGILSENWGSNFAIQSDLTGNHYLADIRTANGANYQYGSIAPTWTPNQYEATVDFKISSVVVSYCILAMSNSTTQANQYPNFSLFVYANGSLYIGGSGGTIYTGITVSFGEWHNILVNITSGTQARISLDGEPLVGYFNGMTAHVYYLHLGTYVSSTNAVCYWDNITIASRIGSLPLASFEHTPSEGNGLTNFIFTDTSTIDNTIFPISYNWTFGDGNYTLTQNSNHTYIHAGTYQVILEVSNRFGSSYAYTNITVSAINIGTGGEEITDDMFGFIIVILLITGLNIMGMKTGYLMLSVFAILGMIIAIPALWVNDPLYITLMMVTALGNVAMLAYGLSRD